MSDRERPDADRARRWMMAALDGEITAEQQAELDRWIEDDPGLRAEWERMSRVKRVTSALALRQPPPEVWQLFWHQVYNRVERGLGWLLFALGGSVLAGYAAWRLLGALWADTQLPPLVRLAIFAVALGLGVLLLSVAREKLFTYRRDPYKEIER